MDTVEVFMDYNEFKKYVKEYFEGLLGKTYRVEIKQVIKNNDTKLDGMIILGEGEDISPTLYLEDFYERYIHGRNLDEVLLTMYRFYMEYKTKNDIDTSLFGEKEKLREKIVFKLVNKEANKELLEDVPYIAFLDLAVVFYIIVNMGENEYATSLIHESHMALWDLTVEELVDISSKNTPKLLKADLMSMEEIAKELKSDIGEFGEVQLEAANQMYILTNRFRTNGAACILYDNVLKDFSEYIGSDIYIIPSSVHEVILIPDFGVCEEELNSMVIEVNNTELDRCEVLSNHIYKYERNTEKIMTK